MRGLKHHLLRVCDPKEEFSVSRYVQLALPVVEELREIIDEIAEENKE